MRFSVRGEGSSVIWPSKDIFVTASSLGRERYHYICLLQDDVNETFLFMAHIKGGRAQLRGLSGYFLWLCPSHKLVPCFFILEGPFIVCHWCPTFLCDWCETDISCHQGKESSAIVPPNTEEEDGYIVKKNLLFFGFS